MQPLYYYFNSSTKKLETSPQPILTQVEKTSQRKFSQSFYNDKKELIETLKCKLKNGIPCGRATRKFPNGESINFEFNNQGMMDGPAHRKLAGGRIISFTFFKGLVLREEDEKYSEAALTPRTPRHERKHLSPVSSLSPTSSTSISDEKSSGKKVTLDSTLLLETVCPKNSANESALRFCHNGNETSIDLKVFVLRLYNLLQEKKIVLTEFNLIGGALQNILLAKKKKKGGDIDFLGYVLKDNGGKVNSKEVLDIFTQVLEETLFPHSSNSYENRMARFTKKPYLLKAFLCNEDFMIVTIPLHLQDPDNPTKMTSVDVDIRINFDNFENKSPCIGSANCLKFNLLRGFLNESWRAIPVTAAKGYEQSVANAVQLLQKGLFFVHEPSAATTLNGLRAYVVLTVKGIFPCDYRSSWVYFIKWQKECEARGSTELGVNEFFQDLEKFLPRHYSMEGGRINLFHVALYLNNMRTIFSLQDWSDSKWCYNKDGFLKIFDMKCLYLLRMPDITPQDLSLIRVLLFWKIASQADRITPFLLSDSKHIITLGNTSEGHGLMMEIPWKETYDCNWEELDKQLVGLQSCLRGMNLPANTQELKSVISLAMANAAFATGIKNACLPEELHMQKMLQLAFHPTFNYAHFFRFFIEQINKNQTSVERSKALRDFVGFINVYQPKLFQNLLDVLEEPLPNLFKAIAIDLEDSDNAQKELFSCLLKPCCDSFREDVLFVIFPHMRSMHNDKSIRKLFTELKQKRMSHHVFCQLLTMALQLPVSRSTWEKLLKYELLRFLESAQDLPPELLKAIFRLFDEHKKIQPDIVVKIFFNLLRLGYDQEQIRGSLESSMKVNPKNFFIYFDEFVSKKLFTPEMLWRIFSNSLPNSGEIQFFHDLSSWCNAKDGTIKPILEQYWSELSKQQKLPKSILEQFNLLPVVSEVIEIVEVVEGLAIEETPEIVVKTPSKSYFETIFESLIKKYAEAYQHSILNLPLAEFWIYLDTERFFELDVTALTKNDVKLFIDFLYPKFQKASVHDIIPIMTGLFDLIPNDMAEGFKNLFEKMVFEDSFLEKSMDYVLDPSTCVYENWQCLEMLIYCSQQYITNGQKVKIKEMMVEAIVIKSMLNRNGDENILILRNIFSFLIDISPNTFTLFFEMYSAILNGQPHLYVVSVANKHSLCFWEELLIPFYKLMNAEWSKLPDPDRLQWFKEMEAHYLKFDTPVLSSDVAFKYAQLSEIFTFRSGPALMMLQLKKRIGGVKVSPVPEDLVIDWSETWYKTHDFPWSTEQCWELFKIFSDAIKIPLPSNQNASLFPTLDNKLAGFFYLQKLIFDMILLENLGGAYRKNFEQNYENIRKLHMNFIKYYKWMWDLYKKSSNDKMLASMSEVLKTHLNIHMNCLTTIRRNSELFYEEYGSLNLELVEFIIEKQVVFNYSDAHALACETGFISYDLVKRKKFLSLMSCFGMSGGALTAAPTFSRIERENIIILFVIKGLQELMTAGKLKKVHESMRELLPLHSALSSPAAIYSVANYMDQNFLLVPAPVEASQILHIICYAYMVIDMCEHSLANPGIKRSVKLAKPICQLPGIEKFIKFIEQTENAFVIENGGPLSKKLISVAKEYENMEKIRA